MMRRKSSRNSRKSPERSNNDSKITESSKKGNRSSRRRKRSSSKSGNESENEKTGTPDVIDSIQEQREHIETTEEFQVNLEYNENEESTKDTLECSENLNTTFEVPEENDEKEEDKGKSKGINNTQNEQSWNNIETENEHVQGTPQSPSNEYADTESVQNVNEIQTDVNVDDSKEECTQNEETSNKEEIVFQSEYAQDSNLLLDNIEQPQSNPNYEEERSTTPEIKNKVEDITNVKKKIILRRITVEKAEKVIKEKKPYQEHKKNNDNDEKKSSRKIILKRHTTELKMRDEQKEGNTSIEDIKIKRRSSASDADGSNKEKKKDKSHDGVIQDKPQEAEVSPKKPSMKIKLVRNFSQEPKIESEDTIEAKLRRRHNWGGSTEWFSNLSAVAFQVDVESIKVICPAVEFLKEEDVKLESEPPKERLNLDVELPRRKLTIDRDGNTGEINSSEDSSNIDHLMSHNRKITIIDDIILKNVSEETVDNRIPSPAKHPISDVLFIANLVRPFTVKQLRELLERTGTIVEDGFWTDRIKSKCYVQYQTVEEAETTRNALHGVNWPVGNGKKLDIDFATVEDLEKAKNPAPPLKVVPEVVPEKENREPQKEIKLKASERDEKMAGRKRDGPVREWDKGKEDMRRRSSSRSATRERVRKHSRRSYTPEIPIHQKRQKRSEEPVPQKLMDDLFLKTKATPSIYWQPLSPEEIARKQHQRLVRMEEHKRRIEENRERLRENRRAPYRRR